MRGEGQGEMVVRDGLKGPIVACIPVSPAKEWTAFSAPLTIARGKKALYFTFEGTGAVDFFSFTFGK